MSRFLRTDVKFRGGLYHPAYETRSLAHTQSSDSRVVPVSASPGPLRDGLLANPLLLATLVGRDGAAAPRGGGSTRRGRGLGGRREDVFAALDRPGRALVDALRRKGEEGRVHLVGVEVDAGVGDRVGQVLNAAARPLSTRGHEPGTGCGRGCSCGLPPPSTLSREAVDESGPIRERTSRISLLRALAAPCTWAGFRGWCG